MGFLHKIWDETLAGPAPESGLGKLRKYDSFSATRPTPAVDLPHISRSITILRTNSALPKLSIDPESPVGSATPSSTPGTPLSPGTPPAVQLRQFSRRKYSAGKAVDRSESEDVHTWMLINPLDR